jgi:hypothetical protein
MGTAREDGETVVGVPRASSRAWVRGDRVRMTKKIAHKLLFKMIIDMICYL